METRWKPLIGVAFGSCTKEPQVRVVLLLPLLKASPRIPTASSFVPIEWVALLCVAQQNQHHRRACLCHFHANDVQRSQIFSPGEKISHRGLFVRACQWVMTRRSGSSPGARLIRSLARPPRYGSCLGFYRRRCPTLSACEVQTIVP